MEALGTPLLASLGFSELGVPQPQCSDVELDAALTGLAFAPQESRIVRLICEGHGDKQIAAMLRIKFSTERTYLSRAFARVGVCGRMELASVVFHRILDNRKTVKK